MSDDSTPFVLERFHTANELVAAAAAKLIAEVKSAGQRNQRFSLGLSGGRVDQVIQVAQRGKILDRESDRVEQRHLARTDAPGRDPRDHAPQLRHREVLGHLLHLTLDARLWLVFDED